MNLGYHIREKINIKEQQELIEKYGTDATRFGLLWQIGQGQDIKFSEDAILNIIRLM